MSNTSHEDSLPTSDTLQRERHNEPTKTNEDMKLIEAKTAVILFKNSRLCTNNEYSQWLLKMLYQPCSTKDMEAMNILYLSRSRRRIWAKDFTINQDNSVDATKKNKDELYVITPKTTILTLSQDNRLVYIIDLSSSLATVGNTRSDILLSEVFQTLRISLENLVQPFSMQISPTEKVIIQPNLRLTVMADCSQFASNVNIIPMLAEYPTMKVFMQNMIISTNNINAVIGKLRTEFHSFQHDATQFRKLLKQTKHHMGYNLDVGNEVTPGEEEIIESAAFSNKKNKTYFPETSAIHTEDTNGTDNKDTKKPALASKGQTSSKTFKSTSYHSTKNEVWGIGKTGANLSRILHAGYFALKLLPDEGRAQLILITDGAMKSNVHDNTFVRQFAEEDITCHIIHIGYYKSFIPGRNFGFVPDIEILKFLAIATNGTFMYSEECLTDANANVFSSNDDRVDRDTSTNKYPVIQSVDLNKATHISRPNIYHIQFLFREIVLTKNHQHTESRLKGEEDSQNKINGRDSLLETNNQIKGRYNFPWDPNSKPPEGEWRLLKYREYILPSEFSHIIAARAREGFSIQSVTFDDGTSSRHGDPAIHDAALLPSAKKERLQIIMVLRWQPNITIEYRIRATWLPSVIGSHVQNEKLLMQNGIFSWGKAPRAEIFVRTDASFAHMLQNWDVFRRRAQMMDVVTGSIFFGEVYASPVYSKIEKLKSYLVDIYEGDEALRSIIGFPNKFWMNATTAPYNETGTQNLGSTHSNSNGFLSNGRLGVIPQQQAYIDAFKVLWEKINASDSRARTRCWYDPGCIDLLIGDVSPYMAPKLLSSYNMDFTSIVEEDILYMVDKLKFVVRDWADFEGKDGTFVKMMQRVISNPSISNEDATKDYFSATRAVLPSFCELRLRHEYGRLATLRLLFFNMPATSRKRTKEHLINLVKTAEETKAACNMICQRPFSRLLMRDKKHFFDDSFSPSSHSSPTLPNHDGKESGLRNFQSSSNKSKAWYLPVAMWLTSEYIVRDYLRHMTWSYSTSNFQDSYHRANKMMPIHDLAFQFLCRARLDQGYQLVSLRTNSIQFYQEITLPDISDSGTSLCAIQYFAWKDTSTGKITTELWLEPGSFNCNRYNIVKRWTFKPDIQTMSQLVTFDEIHAIGRSKKIIDFKDTSNSDQQNDRREGDLETIGLSQLFDVTSILKTNKFVVTSFRSPRYRIGADYSGYPTHPIKIRTISFIMDDNDTSDHSTSSTPTLKQKATNVSKASRYLRRHLHPNSNASSETVSPINSHSWFCIRPDSLLDKNKETIAKLNVVLQNCALLHYFVERSLDYISDGEILMTHHNVSEGFWKQLKSALQSVSHHDATSNITDLIPNLRKTRCLVKVFDPRSFVIILFPSLEYVAKGLLKLQEKDELKPTSRIEKCESLDIFMFECVRQKPMKPTKNEFVFENLMGDDKGCNIESTLEDDDDESNPIIIRKLDYLIHESDGLGLMLRPDIFEGQKKNCPAHAQLTEKVLRVAQDVVRFYSKSFFKSFYSCLLRGFIVDEDDLNKVVEVCDESNMEIEITDFLNILSIQKNMTAESEFKESDIQARFNAIFQHYFEPIKVSNGSLSNLFYYKPSFIRMEGLNNNPDTVSFEDKIANVVDLVAHSQIPLLVRLDCIYRKPNVGQNKPPFTELTVPVNSIPTSFSGTDANGDNFKFEREDVDENSAFPYNRDHTSVYLQIVFLNMVKNDLDDYTADNVMETPKETFAQTMHPQPNCFSSLSQTQQVDIAAVDAKVAWLITEETIHNLLNVPSVTLAILKFVENQLKETSPYLSFETSFKLPFHFVKNNAESLKTFMNELEKDYNVDTNRRYHLKRIENYFYVDEDSVFNMAEESTYSNGGSPVVPDGVPNIVLENADLSSELANNNYCDGLGITLTSADKSEGYNVPSAPDIGLSNQRPLYWLILIPHETHIQIYFYSKIYVLLTNSDILNRVKDMVKRIEIRTNQLVLLNYLQEARVCSKYLEAPTNDDSKDVLSDEFNTDESNESDSSQEIFSMSKKKGFTEKSSISKFMPGQFSCPLLYVKRFPLHWRLMPNVALKYLASDVLRVFTVLNKPNMFVIERDGSIVYCKIYEENLNEGVEDSPTLLLTSPGGMTLGKHTEDEFYNSGCPNTFENTPKREISRLSSASPSNRPSYSGRLPHHEKRELVLEVYGIDLPSWVENEFVDLIENRLISQITLNEIQQFFIRNSTSKPTPADIDFILPVEKPPTCEEVFRMPRLIGNPYTLIQYFKQSLLADSIRALNSPYITEVIKTRCKELVLKADSDEMQNKVMCITNDTNAITKNITDGGFCFYYNCAKRLPGSSTQLELAAGQGIAGICFVILNEVGLPTSTVSEDDKASGSFDPAKIQQCLEEEFREATLGTTRYSVLVNIWVTGTVDGQALMQYIYECYRQSLCDYFIEKTVSIDLGVAFSDDGVLPKKVSSRFEGNFGAILRKKFIKTVLYTLQKASELKSPTVCSTDITINSTPTCMDELIRFLDSELRSIDVSLKPTVAWTPVKNDPWSNGENLIKSDSKWEVYKGFQYRQKEKLQNNIRLVAISGLDDFVERVGSVSDALAVERRPSLMSDSGSHRGRSRRNSGESGNTDGENGQRKYKNDTHDHSRASSALSFSGQTKRNYPQVDSQKHCFLIMTLDVHRLAIYTYNWSDAISQELFTNVARIARRQETRNDLLTNILHQKMGLFHHTEPIKDAIENYNLYMLQSIKPSSILSNSGSTFSATPLIHLSSPKPKRQYEGSIKGENSSVSRISTRRNTGNMPVTASILDLKNMISFPTTIPSRESMETLKLDGNSPLALRQVEQEAYIDQILQRSNIKTAGLDRALMDSATDSVADTSRSKDFDILRRHGQTFLETFLRRAKIQSAHRKALKVYLKWRKQYAGPQEDKQAGERLSRPEVAIIMRSSRVLHFCRTPLAFCDPEKDWSFLKDGSPGKIAVLQWFKTMANDLMAEYAKYLEKADMQLLDFAKPDHGDNSNLRISYFSIGKHLNAECPPTHLLRVFEGGSIICEVRLTSIFVSVTLYILHRQYGGLNYNAFKRETRQKKRSSFMKFEETCGHFKQMIHINSFVHDFQLRYLQKMLRDPNCFPADIDIMSFVKRFAHFNQQPSPYSKDRIISGYYEFEVTILNSTTFFENLFKIAPRQALNVIVGSDGYKAVTASSSTLSFRLDSNEHGYSSDWMYTLVMSPAKKDDTTAERIGDNSNIVIEYYIIVVYQPLTSPESIIQSSWVKNEESKKSLSNVILSEEGYTIADIVSNAKKRIDEIVSKVIVRSKKIEDWKKLYHTEFNRKKGHSRQHPELVRLLDEFDHVDLTEADSNIATIFKMNMDWDDSLDMIFLMKRTGAKDFRDKNDRHLLLYNARYMDYMIHLKVKNDNTIEGWMVSREERIDKTHFEGAEIEQMTNLSKMFFYYMWRNISGRKSINYI